MSALRLKIPWLGFWWAVKDSNLSTLPLCRDRSYQMSFRTRNEKAPHDGEALNSLSTIEAMATISDLHEMYAI